MNERSVVITDEAQLQLINIPSDKDYVDVRKMLGVLGIVYSAGSVYDPAYEAAKPPMECRVVYAGHYGIYYSGEPDPNLPIVVFSIEDQRRDPNRRFSC